jgi:putative ABC transport system permease protein
VKQHIVFALRQMGKYPGTSILAIIILALGVGANTALFTVIDSVLLRPLPYQKSDKIVIINNGTLQPVGVDSWLDYEDLYKRAKDYEAIAAFTVDSPVVHTGQSSKLVSAVRTTANLFAVLKIRPILGRAFTNDDNRTGSLPVVLVTTPFWHANLNSDPNVIGRQLMIGDTASTVIGVLPPELKFPELWGSDVAHGIWLPLQVTPDMLTQRSNKFLVMVGRLRPGIGIEAARREAFAITDALSRSIGENQVAFTVVLLKDLVTGDVRPALLALTAAMALILLMACAGVATLQSARFLSRTQEFAVRTALGASRRKLIAQVLAEVSVMCAFGGAVGFGIAWILLRSIALFPPDTIARAEEIRFRWETMAAFAGIILFTAVFSALVPALQTARNNARLASSERARGTSAGPEKIRISKWLISGEVALSAILLISAVLMLRTVLSLRSVTAGFDPQRVTMFWAVPGQSSGFLQNTQNGSHMGSLVTRIYEPMLEQLAHLPGVTGAAFTSAAPLNNLGMQAGFNIVGQNDKYPPVFLRAVSPDYARVLGTPILRGRMIADSDTADSQFVAVVNQAFVAQYLESTDPLGKELELAKSIGLTKPYRIVGVLANTVQNEVAQSPAPEVSIAYRQITPASPFYGLLVAPQTTYIVRTHGNIDVMPAIRNLFTADAPEMALDSVQTLEEAQYNNTFRQRLSLYLIGGFAVVAVLLVVAGLYGVLSQLVGQRRQEIGVRMALGATRSEILRLVGKQGLVMIAVGLTIGFITTLAFGRFISSFLYGVKPTDILSYIAVLLILLLVGCSAILVPAYRASRMEPADSLRMN